MWTKKDRELNEWFNKLKVGNLPNFINKFCGRMLGRGLYRDVYAFRKDSDYVVKIERDMASGSFSNIIEWRTYIDNQEWKAFAQYLAPCIGIDVTGQILIQKRVKFKDIKFYPKKMLGMFSDFKIQNYGWIGKQFVCCDYAGLLIGRTIQMKNAEWWDIEEN